MEQKKFIFMYRTHIRDEPARPDPARRYPTMTPFDGLFLKFVRRYELEIFT